MKETDGTPTEDVVGLCQVHVNGFGLPKEDYQVRNNHSRTKGVTG